MARVVPVLCVYTVLHLRKQEQIFEGYSKDGWEIRRGEARAIVLPFMSDATQQKRGRSVRGLSSSDTESCWGWSWLTSCTLGAHAWPRLLHPSGSAELISCSSINGARASEPLSPVNHTRGWTQGVTLVILLFLFIWLLSLNAQSLWYNQWLVGE